MYFACLNPVSGYVGWRLANTCFSATAELYNLAFRDLSRRVTAISSIANGLAADVFFPPAQKARQPSNVSPRHQRSSIGGLLARPSLARWSSANCSAGDCVLNRRTVSLPSSTIWTAHPPPARLTRTSLGSPATIAAPHFRRPGTETGSRSPHAKNTGPYVASSADYLTAGALRI